MCETERKCIVIADLIWRKSVLCGRTTKVMAPDTVKSACKAIQDEISFIFSTEEPLERIFLLFLVQKSFLRENSRSF